MCPDCKKDLNKGEEVVLTTQSKMHANGKIYLSPSIGEYGYRHFPDIDFKDGELVEFLCPHCRSDLHSYKHKDYIKLLMKTGDAEHVEVLFSRKNGIKRTFILRDDEVEKHGDDVRDGDDETFKK